MLWLRYNLYVLVQAMQESGIEAALDMRLQLKTGRNLYKLRDALCKLLVFNNLPYAKLIAE
jgi:hypothetical protein